MNDTICDPVVQMGTTQIIGETYVFEGRQVNQYLSIPYAEPPIGQLRFQKTVPLERYPDVINAIDVPPACMQYTEYPFPWYINSTHKSEDCLYLNIWTPADASPQNRKAVMFWVHGGGYRYGSIRDKLYSGIALAALGDIIVVTVNFRVGVFAFLTSYTDDAPGNGGK
ncbi:Acetylcholinesterase-1 [Araneus ventricosus]|uniref:Acetylcholinesterase-1 n=1 Tax=Araneus ventricosus TaxID=182803 RepID=A0A4Y2IHE9_ARAVE|nr:Acetylcholinesterase-1 [Araneus ventricosus]